METELKLLVAPADLPRVLRLPLVKLAQSGPVRRTTLRALYFDTPGHALAGMGMVLRVRRESGRWIQAVKGDDPAGGALSRRIEIEWQVPGPVPDLALVRDSELGALLRGARAGKWKRELVCVFETRFRRATAELSLPGGASAQLCVDSGSILAAGSSLPVSEVEIELRDGDPAVLLDFASALRAELPFRMGVQSKAERGHALFGAHPDAPARAEAVALRRRQCMDPALVALLAGCARQFHLNEQGAREGGDPEYLHQARVALRRLRVALALRRDAAWRERVAPLQSELRWLSAELGELRDLEVLSADVVAPLAALRQTAPGLRSARGRLSRAIGLSRARARAALDSPRCTLVMLDLARLLAGPLPAAGDAPGATADVQASGAALLERRWKKLRQLGGEDVLALPAERLHALRIVAKKLRYAASFFASLHPGGRHDRFAAALARLQDQLGTINDCVVAARLVRERLAAPAGARADVREAAGLACAGMDGWIAARQHAARAKLDSAWHALLHAKPHWR